MTLLPGTFSSTSSRLERVDGDFIMRNNAVETSLRVGFDSPRHIVSSINKSLRCGAQHLVCPRRHVMLFTLRNMASNYVR
jgi:hypothetical protein